MLFNEPFSNNLSVDSDRIDRALVIITHQFAVTLDISAEDSL
jgi:hypothetical protein